MFSLLTTTALEIQDYSSYEFLSFFKLAVNSRNSKVSLLWFWLFPATSWDFYFYFSLEIFRDTPQQLGGGGFQPLTKKEKKQFLDLQTCHLYSMKNTDVGTGMFFFNMIIMGCNLLELRQAYVLIKTFSHIRRMTAWVRLLWLLLTIAYYGTRKRACE